MPATSQMMFTEECHSLQSTEKRDASKRIPRPPNAFMLYRSDLLKRKAIPPEVEKRQQHLSRIAGQCWNMLPGDEKAVWFHKAAVIRAEHRAKYPFYQTRPSRKETKRLSKEKRGAANSVHPSGRFTARRTQTPYCEGIALHDSTLPFPASEANPISPTTVSESLWSTAISLSPLTSPCLLSPSTLPRHSGRQDSPSTPSDSAIDKVGNLLDLTGSEISQGSRLFHTVPGEMGTSTELYPVPQQHDDDFAFSTPCLEPMKFQNDPFTQAPSTLSGLGIFPRYNLAEDISFLNDFHPADASAHFSRSLVPLYPRRGIDSGTCPNMYY